MIALNGLTAMHVKILSLVASGPIVISGSEAVLADELVAGKFLTRNGPEYEITVGGRQAITLTNTDLTLSPDSEEDDEDLIAVCFSRADLEATLSGSYLFGGTSTPTKGIVEEVESALARIRIAMFEAVRNRNSEVAKLVDAFNQIDSASEWASKVRTNTDWEASNREISDARARARQAIERCLRTI